MNLKTAKNDTSNRCDSGILKVFKDAVSSMSVSDLGDNFESEIDKKNSVNCDEICKKNDLEDIQIKKIAECENQQEELKEAIQRLTSENKYLHEQIKSLNSRFKVLVSKLSEAVVVVDNDGKIAFTNDHFKNMLSLRDKEMVRRGNKIEGMKIHYFLTPEFYRQVLSVQTKGEDLSWIETTIDKNIVTASICSIKRGDYTIIILRDMGDSAVMKDQAIKQLKSVIDQNMAMVQKIGFLLGEEVSDTSKLLYQTINSLSNKIEHDK